MFDEDVVVLEAQQRNIDLRPDLELVTPGIDDDGAHTRRLMERAAQETPPARP